MKALQAYNRDDLNNLANRAKIVSMQNNKKDNVDYTLTKRSVVTMSNSFVGIQNEFNKIVANITDLKMLQAQEANAKTIASNDNNQVATRIIGADQLGDSVDVLGEIFETLAKLLKKLDLKTPETTQPETGEGGDIDIDIDRRRGRRTRGRGRSRLRGRGLAGKALGIFGVGLDVTDRLSSGEDVAEAAVGVAGGVAGGIGGAQAGAALGALGGPAAPLTIPLGGLIGGALGYLAGGFVADKAYDAVAEPSEQRSPVASKPAAPVKSSTDRRLEGAIKTATAVPARREPSEISNNSYSSRFANYLSDVFENVKGYIGGIAGAAVGAAAGLVGGVNPPDLSGTTNQSFQNIMDIAASMGDPHPELTAAQWALESGNGTSRMARELNNPFGQTTNNPEEGQAVTGRDGVKRIFKRYNSTEDAIRHHVDRWNQKYTTKDQTPEQALTAIINNRYVGNPNSAEASQYYSSIAGILSSNNISYRQVYTYTPSVTSAGPQPQGGAGLASPMPGFKANSEFGMRKHPIHGDVRMHDGLDYSARAGTPILASGSGTVVFAGARSGYGNTIEIDHGDGLVTRYAHMSQFSVANGATVTQGQRIGAVGATGNVTGAHLHFEVLRNGRAQNPRTYINAPVATPSPVGTPSRASLMANRLPLNATNYFEALKANPKRGNGSLIMMPSPAPAQQTITFPYKFGQTPPRQPNANPRGAYPAYHGQ